MTPAYRCVGVSAEGCIGHIGHMGHIGPIGSKALKLSSPFEGFSYARDTPTRQYADTLPSYFSTSCFRNWLNPSGVETRCALM